MSEYLNEAKYPANIYHLSQDNLGGKVLSPRIPSYLYDDESIKKNQDVGLYEENSIPRVSFSSDIQGCLRAIIPDLNANPEMKNMYLGKTLYVHVPENPYESYKRISNKEIIKNKYVFDAEFTKEEWILEPVKLKCIGQIKILSVSSSKNVKIDHKTNFRLQTFEYQWWTQNESSLNESIKSYIDSDYTSKGKKSLSSFKRVKLSKEVISKYKKDFKALSHIRENCEGYLFLDGDRCVAVVAVEDKGDHNFIQGIEIDKEYQGYGLSKQLLKIAVDELKAKKLSVNKRNKLAINIYKKYGFKTYDKTETMLFMSFDESSLNEEASEFVNNIGAYHLEPKIGNEKITTGCWDEELYSRSIESAINNDIKSNYKTKDLTTVYAYVFTAGENLKPIYLGVILIPDKNNPSDWKWDEKTLLSDDDIDYLKNNPIGESYIGIGENMNMIINKKDLEVNLDKFESGEENVLLITGLSGSGKSTLAEKLSSKYKCTYYELDCLTFYMKGLLTKEDAIGGEEGLVAFIESKNLKPDKNISYKTWASLYREYIEFLINWYKRQKNKKFIIEGLQIYEVYEDGDTFITSCPIIIKGTSGLVSSIRAAKRNDGSFFKEFGPLIKWVLQDVKHIEKLKKAVSESYIEEATKSNYKFISIRKSNEIDDFYSALKEVFGEDDEDGISREDVRKYGKRIKFNNTYIGYICIIDDIYENNKKYIGICNFIILPKYQRKGHGANIIHELVEQNKSKFDEIYCWVETDNTDAIRFYKRIGDVYDDVKPRTTKSGGSVYYVCLYKKPENVSESYDESYVEEGALRQTFMSIPIKTLNMKNKTPINSMTDLMKYHKNPGLELYTKKCKDIDDLKYLQKDLRYTIPSIQKAKERIALCRKLGECSTTKSYYKGIKKMYLDQGITEKDCDLTIKGLNGTQKVISDRIKELKSANESYIEESNVEYNFKSNPMYFLSGVSMNDELLTPRIPSNYFTKNGYEDNKTPRVCFASSIDKALMGLSQNLKGKMFYVHVPEKGQYLEIYKPSLNEVPDSKITGEIWVKNPVNVKCIGKILVISDDGKDGHKFKYGDNESELYGWNWNWEWNEQESTSLELALYLKDEVRKHLLESTNNEYYRVTYHGIGIYEALRNNVSNEEWRVILNNSQSIKWLPKPPNYNFNNRSYFTKLGYNTFNKKTLPLIRKYLNPNDIKTEIYNTLDGSIVYIDKYQIVVDVSNLHTDQDTISNRDKALEMKTFYEGYASDEVILQEMKRSILPDEVFGIPELRKYPMPDRKHVLSAIRFFNHVDYKYERQLAKRIIINMKKYNIDGSHVGKDNRLRKYLPKDMKDLAVKEIYEDDVHEDFLSQKSKPAKNQRAHVSYLKNKRKTHINNKATAVNTLSGNNSPSFQFQNSAAILHDDLFNYLIESENTKERKRPIFIVTSWTNTVFGKIISKWTKSTYTHAAIGFDTKLDKLYSYNANNKINKLGGFSVESIDEYRNIYENSQICVSTFFVKESDFHKIKEGLDRLENNLKKTKYDFINILNIFFNRAVEVGAKGQEVLSLVCSEFVAWLISLADINIVDKPINLITPKDLSNFNNLKIYKLYEGYVRNYDKNKIDRIFNNLKKTANVIKESMIIEYMEMKKK